MKSTFTPPSSAARYQAGAAIEIDLA